MLLAYFDEHLPQPCGHCDNCIDTVETWDATEPARQALSAIYRSGQRYGVGHLVDILLGRETEKIVSLGHQRLAVFGLGKAPRRRRMAHPVPPAGRPWPGRGGCRRVRRPAPDRKAAAPCCAAKCASNCAVIPSPSAGGAAVAVVRPVPPASWCAPTNANAGRFLRTLRRKLAEEHSVPPYVIFPDATLLEMLRSSRARWTR